MKTELFIVSLFIVLSVISYLLYLIISNIVENVKKKKDSELLDNLNDLIIADALEFHKKLNSDYHSKNDDDVQIILTNEEILEYLSNGAPDIGE